MKIESRYRWVNLDKLYEKLKKSGWKPHTNDERLISSPAGKIVYIPRRIDSESDSESIRLALKTIAQESMQNSRSLWLVVFEQLVTALLPREVADDFIGDVETGYIKRYEQRGSNYANFFVFRETVSMVWYSLHRQFQSLICKLANRGKG